ncbi:MAG: four helix bundle protein [Pirellulaceae bacterium]
MRDHNTLRAFELADQLVVLLYSMTSQFPKQEQFGLTSQMRRAAISIPSNIVEGCAKESEADFVRFLGIAYGSAKELEYQVSLAARLGFFENEEAFKSLMEMCVETCKVLSGLIRSFRRA